jgi:hypothetical protein
MTNISHVWIRSRACSPNQGLERNDHTIAGVKMGEYSREETTHGEESAHRNMRRLTDRV